MNVSYSKSGGALTKKVQNGLLEYITYDLNGQRHPAIILGYVYHLIIQLYNLIWQNKNGTNLSVFSFSIFMKIYVGIAKLKKKQKCFD